jgi:diaminohydroxyphosphoribosylaminopyrimidine deaminase/5-amino-6-(5-phosphoribosylamino)uracil reductase
MPLDIDTPTLQAHLRDLAREAREMRFDVAPNPCVGAGILAGGKLIVRGMHGHWGGPHAEVVALKAAAASGVPRGSWEALLVTLEPCSSFGKTPPCTEAIIAAGISRVVVGCLDPDPRHRGSGLEALKNAGIEVINLDGTIRLRDQSPHFLRWLSPERLRIPRPWTIAKWAQTRSGQLLPPKDVGGGRWISGPEALAEVQVLRGRVEGIMTGFGTVRADNPRFTVRPPGQRKNPPQRFILDSDLRTPPDARLFAQLDAGDETDEAGGQVVIFCRFGADVGRARALAAAGADVQEVRSMDRTRLDLQDILLRMHERGIERLLLEAGPQLTSAMLEAGVVDQVCIYTGDVLGGEGATLADALVTVRLVDRRDLEVGDTSRVDSFVTLPPGTS